MALAFDKDSAAKEAGVSKQTLDRAIKAGKLRVKRTSEKDDGTPTGKVIILASALDAWLESLVDG